MARDIVYCALTDCYMLHPDAEPKKAQRRKKRKQQPVKLVKRNSIDLAKIKILSYSYLGPWVVLVAGSFDRGPPTPKPKARKRKEKNSQPCLPLPLPHVKLTNTFVFIYLHLVLVLPRSP